LQKSCDICCSQIFRAEGSDPITDFKQEILQLNLSFADKQNNSF